jgi:uncharacterized protein YprB with RNaseH-like and TPR domain
MSLLDRLAHARALDRLSPAARLPRLPGVPDMGPRPPVPTPPEAASSDVAFHRRERLIDLEPDPWVGHAREFGRTRSDRASLLGGCLERLTLPSVGALARDLVCLGSREGGRAVFLDTETTGLGTVCVPFVVGIAWIDGTRLHCTQWTLGRCSGEAELLADVLARLEAHGPAPLVSFNGASFDLPLLRLRAHRHGLSARVLEAEHVDLLHPARRLARGRHRDCRLATLESELLGVRRRGDIEPAEIPEVFWTWVRSPNDIRAQRRLRAVCDHNLIDLVSLPALATWLANAVREPGDLDRALRAARHLDRLGAAEQARLVLSRFIELEDGAAAQDGAAAAMGARWREAALHLALLERRAGDRARAGQLWRAAWQADPGCPDACEAWAKHLEHQLRDFAEALRVARGSRAPCDRRIARLEARLGRVQVQAEPEPQPAASEAPPSAGPELRERIAQTDHGAVVRYRLFR